MTSNEMSIADGVNVTVSWGPSAGEVSYRVTVVPVLTSGQSKFVTMSTRLQLTLEYSINYTVQVVAFNCAGNSSVATLYIDTPFVHKSLQNYNDFVWTVTRLNRDMNNS